jgi:transposase
MKQQTSAASEAGTKGRDIIDFTGKTIYVGIDVHQKDYQVAKICDGICLGNHRMEARAETLIKHLASRYQGADFQCVYESCSWGFNLQRKLTKAGMSCIVVHAADVSTSDKERRRKTDKVDALKLADNLWRGHLKGVHVPDLVLQKQRTQIRLRSQLTADITKSKNRVKSLLKYQGIEIPAQYANSSWSRNFLNWVEQQALKDEHLKDSLLLMVEQIKLLRGLLLKLERSLRQLRKHHYESQAKLAMSVPGIGHTTAMMFLLEIGDINRFKGFDTLNDFIGFCPDTASSGQTNRSCGITTRRHKKLRSGLIEAAWQAIRIDPALLESYQALTKRMKGTQAIIRIARKLLRRLRAVLISGIPYQRGVMS